MSLTECRCCEHGKDGTKEHTELSYAVKTPTGERDFASCSNHVNNYRRAGFTIRKLERSDKVRIGEHEVKVLSKTEVQIGCQKVSREQVDSVVRLLDEYRERPRYHKYNDDPRIVAPGAVAFWLHKSDGRITLHCRFNHEYGISTNWVLEINGKGELHLADYIHKAAGLTTTEIGRIKVFNSSGVELVPPDSK